MAIKIEERKSYVAHDGEIWDDAQTLRYGGLYQFKLRRRRDRYIETFTEFGQVMVGQQTSADLVAEYVAPEAKTALPVGPHIIVGASDAVLLDLGPFTHDEAVAKAKELAEGAPGAEFHIYQRVGGFVGKTTVEAL